MPKKWVVNASPIISLCSINKASFLIELHPIQAFDRSELFFMLRIKKMFN